MLWSELTDLIRKWIEEERLNALNVTPPPVPFDPLTRDLAEIAISPAKTSEKLSVVEVDEVAQLSIPPLLLRSLLPSQV